MTIIEQYSTISFNCSKKEFTMNVNEIKEQICDVCHKMWQLGWVAANDGNVSVKLDDGTFIATPTGVSKSFITPDILVRINDKGEVLEAAEGRKPSSEIKMHLRCYRERPDVGQLYTLIRQRLQVTQSQTKHLTSTP